MYQRLGKLFAFEGPVRRPVSTLARAEQRNTPVQRRNDSRMRGHLVRLSRAYQPWEQPPRLRSRRHQSLRFVKY